MHSFRSQTRKAMFDHISKHREESWKYDAQRSIFDELRVFGNVMKSCLECLVPWSSQSKLKLRRKRRNKIIKNLCHKIHIFNRRLSCYFFCFNLMNRVWLWEVLKKTKHESLQNFNTFLTIKELTFEHIKVILCWPTRIKCNKPRALHKLCYPANGKNIFMLTRYVKPMEHDGGNGRSLLAWRPQSIVS
jgi:hypothetical protein